MGEKKMDGFSMRAQALADFFEAWEPQVEDELETLDEACGKVVHHYIAAAPGRPLMMAVADGKPVVDLPGPPLAAYYGTDWCLQAIVCRMLGVPVPRRQTVRVERPGWLA